MKKINEELISKLEKLAHLNLEEEEKKKITEDLNSIVDMFDKLQEVDTSNVEPLKHIMQDINRYRNDTVKGELTNEEALKNVKTSVDGFIAVPKFLKPKKV